MAYEFHYTPTGTGVISGKEVLEQTEDAINDLGNTAISGVQEALDKAEQALTNSENAVDDAQTALNTANNAEGVAIQAQNDVSNLSGTVTNIGNRVTTAEGNIGNLQGRMTTAEGNITNLQGRMTTAEGNIGNLQTAVSTAQATANSAQQTATTARQQSYVFRYSSTALTASSTNSNALLDNTNNLKVGDKVIDSSGVIYSVTAIDTANSTFTIGTSLIDLAQDSDVVHKSGNETVGGIKSFSDDTYIKSLNFTNEVPSPSSSSSSIMPIITTITYGDSSPMVQARLNLRVTANGDKSLYPHENNAYSLGLTSRKWSEVHGVTYYYGSSDVEFSTKFVTTDTAQTISGAKTLTDILTGTAIDCTRIRSKGDSQAYIVFRQSDQTLPGSIVIRANDGTGTTLHITGGSFRAYTNNTVSLGTSSVKWTDVATNAVNGLEPSALGMPDFANGIDISSYITHLDKVVNNYTPPSNGWLSIRVKKTSLAHTSLMMYQTGGLLNSCETTEFGISGANLPVIANQNVEIYIIADNLASAKFYPCLGNV